MEKKVSITFVLLVVAIVFIYVRPYEVVPALEQLKITKVSLFAALVFSFLEGHRKGFLLKEGGFRIVFALQLLAAALIPFSLWPANSYDFWINTYIKVFMLFYLFLLVATDFQRLNLLIKTIFLSCSVVALRAVAAFASGNVIYDADGTRRVYGISMLSSTDPNDMALAFAMAVPLGLYLAYASKGAWRYIYAALALANTAAIVFTGSRGGYLGLISCLSIFFFSVYRKKKGRLIALALAAALIAAVFVPEEYKERFNSAFDSSDYSYADEKAGRIAIWKRGVRSAFENPMGTGIKTFTITEGERRREEGFTGRWNSAHNSYIQIAVELGLLGFTLYIMLLWSGFKSILKVLSAPEGEGMGAHRLCAYALAASLIAFSVSSLFLSQAYYWNQYFFVALAIGLRKVTLDKAGEGMGARAAA